MYSSTCISIPSVWTLPETGMADADLHQCSGQESREQSVNYYKPAKVTIQDFFFHLQIDCNLKNSRR